MLGGRIVGYLLVVVIIIVIAFAVIKKTPQGSETRGHRERLPYKKKDYLLSKAERSFYIALLNVLDQSSYSVLVKVRMLDLLYIPKSTEKLQSYQNKVQSKSIDFVVCSARYLSPLFVIEIGNSTSGKNDFVSQAFRDSGLQFIRVPQQQTYSEADISARISSVLMQVEAAPTK
jgi:hypothetical protein